MTDHNVMIDIETLSSKSDAAVVSIGLAAFGIEEGVTETAEFLIDLEEIYGRISPDTVAWWMGHGKNASNDEAREATFGGERNPAYAVALGLRDFIRRHGGDACLVWANSPSFDIAILRNWWATMPDRFGNRRSPTVADEPFPVIFRNERDCRTIFALGRDLSVDTADCWLGVGHSALDDAANQARAVVKILRHVYEQAAKP